MLIFASKKDIVLLLLLLYTHYKYIFKEIHKRQLKNSQFLKQKRSNYIVLNSHRNVNSVGVAKIN